MRPKKVILCVNCSDPDLSALSFVLTIYGFRVLEAGGAAQALDLLLLHEEGGVDLVLASPGENLKGIEAMKRIRAARPYIPMLLVGAAHERQSLLAHADAFLTSQSTPAEMLERVRIMSTRKRGPRKHLSAQLSPEQSNQTSAVMSGR